MKMFVSVFCVLLVFSFIVLPLVFCDFSVSEDAHAPVLSLSWQNDARPLSLTLSPAALKASPVIQGIGRAASFLPFFVKDGVAMLTSYIGELCGSLSAILV